MNLTNTRLPRQLASLLTILATVTGLVLIGVLPIFNGANGPVTLANYIHEVTNFMKNITSVDPTKLSSYLHMTFNVAVYLATYITALIFLIKCIISLAKLRIEPGSKRIVFDSLKLSFTLLTFFGFSMFLNYSNLASIAVGGYLALGLGVGAVLFALANFFMASQKESLNKLLRICFVLVAYAASIIVLMPTITVSNASMGPGLYLFTIINEMIVSGTVDYAVLSGAFTMFVLLVVAYAFVSTEAAKIIDERTKNNGRRVASIVLTAIAFVLTLGALFGGKLTIPNGVIGLSTFGIVSIVLMALTVILAILVFVLTKKEEVVITPIEFTQYNTEEQEIEETPVEETPVEEVKKEATTEEATTEEVVSSDEFIAAATISEVAIEEKAEEPVKEEEPAKEKANKVETPKKEATKKASTKKSKEKKEDKEAKKNASYHISKRASDNKWQVFRAGSEKVIKLFDTKVEAEEYTKVMAENQGVGYLSHASKGKNKGRIQKK